jgi:hypothetical protein
LKGAENFGCQSSSPVAAPFKGSLRLALAHQLLATTEGKCFVPHEVKAVHDIFQEELPFLGTRENLSDVSFLGQPISKMRRSLQPAFCEDVPGLHVHW